MSESINDNNRNIKDILFNKQNEKPKIKKRLQ